MVLLRKIVNMQIIARCMCEQIEKYINKSAKSEIDALN